VTDNLTDLILIMVGSGTDPPTKYGGPEKCLDQPIQKGFFSSVAIPPVKQKEETVNWSTDYGLGHKEYLENWLTWLISSVEEKCIVSLEKLDILSLLGILPEER